jgi:lysophospholipase L1-like esterase
MTNRARSSTHAARRSLGLALSVLLFSCGASVHAATGDGSLTDPNITYVGRWDKSDSTTYRSYWDGAYVSTKFTGTNVKVKLASQTTFKVIIDGTLSTYWGASGTINLTPTPLAAGTHTLQIIAHYNDCELPFQGLVLDAGASTVALDSRPLVEFIGDSITAGHSTSDWAVTDYAWQTGERLGAQHTQIAYSGITLADGYHYSDNNWPGMESLYFKLQPVNHCPDVACASNPAWNFANYTARLVVVNLGTNDQNLGAGSTPAATFQSRYTTFLQNIRAKYPNADIFAMRTFGNYYVPQTQAAVNARQSTGDSKVHFIDTTGWLDPYPSADFSDGFHPSDAGHMKITNRLLPILLPYIGVVTFNDNQFSFDNTGNWGSGWQTGAYQNDNHWSGTANSYYQVPFSGTQARLYGARAPWHGIAAVSIDGGAETNVDTYAAARADGVLLWSSPLLAAGPHTLKVRVTGSKHANSTNTSVAADRVDIVNGGLNLLSNPGFENGLSGWGVWPAGTAYAETSRPNSGTSHLTNWSANPYYVATYQTLTGLSSGLYTVRAWVRGSGGQQLYVKNFGGAQVSANLAASDAYTQVVISNINVSNGSAEIGFWSNDAWGNGWLGVDDVTFYKQ